MRSSIDIILDQTRLGELKADAEKIVVTLEDYLEQCIIDYLLFHELKSEIDH